MQTTRYFDEQVLRKRPYLTIEMCSAVVAQPIVSLKQEDGRFRFWGYIHLPGEAERRILRVGTLDDGTTIHNAFVDRNFKQALT
jgi:hypothetical protein